MTDEKGPLDRMKKVVSTILFSLTHGDMEADGRSDSYHGADSKNDTIDRQYQIERSDTIGTLCLRDKKGIG